MTMIPDMCQEYFLLENSTDEIDEMQFSNYTTSTTALPKLEELAEKLLYENIKFCSYNIILPIIFLFGIVGNVLNIVIFNRRGYRNTLDDIEKSATAGLVALSISDILFCVVGLLEPILGNTPRHTSQALRLMSLYYRAYKTPLTNVFLFSSTWLVVAISAERYVAVCYPLHARWFIQLKRTITVDVTIYILSLLINIPGFLKYRVVQFKCDDGRTHFMMTLTEYYYIHHGYVIAYSVLGVFIPLVFLTLCNIRLMVEVFRSRKRYRTERHKYATSRATLILMAIILMYLILVCPSMLLTFFSDILSQHSLVAYYQFQTAVVFTNVTQGINFAVNFALYCAVSKPFRDNVKGQLCRSSVNISPTDNRYQLVNTHPDTVVTRAPKENSTHL